MIAQPQTVAQFFATSYIQRRFLAPATAYQYRRAIRDLDEWSGQQVAIAELSDELVGAWLAARLRTEAPRTLRGRRTAVLAVWRLAAADGLCEPPRAVPIVKTPRPVPVAWTLDELRRLLTASAGTWAEVLIRLGYESGLRRGDLLRLPDVPSDGEIRLLQHKTGLGHVCRVRPATAALVRRGLAVPPLKRMYRELRALCDRAGVRRGAIQQLRRTGATHLERISPGAAPRYLGHRSADLAYRHYVDVSQLGPAPQPPPLD